MHALIAKLHAHKKKSAAALFGVLVAILVVAHPYGRQLVFGPRIGFTPLMVYQEDFRRLYVPHEYKQESPWTKTCEWLGVKRESTLGNHDAISHGDWSRILVGLADDPSTFIREQVAFKLNGHHDEASIAALCRLLDDPSDGVRMKAHRSLAAMGSDAKGALPKVRILMSSNDPKTRWHAGQTTWSIASDADEILALARMEIKSTDVQTRSYGIHLLTLVGKKLDGPIEEIGRILESEPSASVRNDAAFYFCARGPKGVPILIKLLRDPDANVRRRALRSLLDCGAEPRDVGPIFRELLDHPDPVFRSEIVRALCQIDPNFRTMP